MPRPYLKSNDELLSAAAAVLRRGGRLWARSLWTELGCVGSIDGTWARYLRLIGQAPEPPPTVPLPGPVAMAIARLVIDLDRAQVSKMQLARALREHGYRPPGA